MNELLKRIRKEVLNAEGISDTVLVYEPGTGEGEYDVPDKLMWKLGAGNKSATLEFSCKLGTSWYIPGGSNIRIFTVGLRKNGLQWYEWQHKYLDVTLIDDSLVDWAKDQLKDFNLYQTEKQILDVDSVDYVRNLWKVICHDVTRKLGKELPGKFKHGMVKSPRIRYYYNDEIEEEYYIMETIEIKFPTVSRDQKITSFLIQKKRYKDNSTTISYNLRVTTQTNPALLVSLSDEKLILGLDDLKTVLREEFNKYLKEVILPQIPKDLRSLIGNS